MKALQDQVALVVGATGAVGSAVVERLVDEGARVCATGRTRESLDRWTEATASRQRIERHPVDLDADEAIEKFARDFGDRHAALDVLIHCAGVIALGTVMDSRLEDFDRQYRINVRGPYQLTRALLPLIVRTQGQIVFVNSTAGLTARKGLTQYAATKHALRAVADGLRDEVNEHGVRVLSVFLGRTAGAMQAAVHQSEGRDYDGGALVQAADVASVVVHSLVLPRTAEITELRIRPMAKPR
jgi:NADP-dependent 3-hydroxy acid dehydrogenase YdfG